MVFYCKICNKNYKTYQSLWNHNKKFHEKIEKKQEYICKYCNLVFVNRHKKCYHQKKCNKDTKQDTNKDTNQTINNNKIINNNINNGIINNTNNNIIINNYGNDNLEYISEKFKDRMFKHIIFDEDHHIPLPQLIENIKFNPNHKENNNVKIKSDRSKIGFYYDENKWKAINKDELLNELCDYSLKIFKQYFKERKDKLSEDMQCQFENFVNEARFTTDLRCRIKTKIENIAYIFSINNENILDK